jgi:hypothetical protein
MIPAILALALAAGYGSAQQRDPADLLRTLEDDLRKATRTSGDQREKLRIAAKSAFDKDVAAAVLKNPKASWDHFSDYLTSLGKAERSFGGKNEGAERLLWIQACKMALQRQLTQCKDTKFAAGDRPTTTELFNALVDAMSNVKTRYIGEGVQDLREAAYDMAYTTFRTFIRKARAPSGEPKNLYAAQLAKIDKSFMIVADERAKNDLPNRLLKEAAKDALDRALQAQSQK